MLHLVRYPLDSVLQHLLEFAEQDDGLKFLMHEFNRDGDSYRSPWDNKYYPKPDDGDGVQLPPHLKLLEEKFNTVFKQYAQLYFDAAETSVYVAESDAKEGFNAAFLIRKELTNEKHVDLASWDSIHVVNCEVKDNKLNLEVTSTVFVMFDCKYKALGKMSLAGSCAKQ